VDKVASGLVFNAAKNGGKKKLFKFFPVVAEGRKKINPEDQEEKLTSEKFLIKGSRQEEKKKWPVAGQQEGKQR